MIKSSRHEENAKAIGISFVSPLMFLLVSMWKGDVKDSKSFRQRQTGQKGWKNIDRLCNKR